MGKSKYSNEFKTLVLQEEKDKEVSRLLRRAYKDSCEVLLNEEDGVFDFVLRSSHYQEYRNYLENIDKYDCAIRLNESKKKKYKRVMKKMQDIVLGDNAIFVTLTFRDEVFEKTNKETRRRYVARYLKQYASNYVANIDYGEDERFTHREHYHALIDKEIDLSVWKKKMGIVNVERVHSQNLKKQNCTLEDDLKACSKYIVKLTNHALKLGEIAPRLIYSRNTI